MPTTTNTRNSKPPIKGQPRVGSRGHAGARNHNHDGPKLLEGALRPPQRGRPDG
jgi:hypothetical protein